MAQVLPAQRLWLLERPAGRPGLAVRAPRDFAGAVAVLDHTTVFVVVIISNDPARTAERSVFQRGDRQRLERDALRFDTLDAAMEAVSRLKARFVARGWRDCEDAVTHDYR